MMNPAKLLYIDRHGVSITRFSLKVKNQLFPLKEIQEYAPVVINSNRGFGILALMFGIVLITSGYVNATSFSILTDISNVSGSMLMTFCSGVFLAVLGILTIALIRTRYALQIITEDGVKNAVVSAKKDYIIQLIQVLHTAMEQNHHKNPVIQKVKSEMLESNSCLSLN